ncbi:MAG: response regulator, partial [Deltaproteobacteria bacterium]|nr:response regulator [Deltaproteobacteria bacterium]
RFRLMFERSADAILLLDTAINKFVEYNQAALDMLRCSKEELSVLHPSELSPPLQPDGRDSFTSANERIASAVRDGSHRFEWIHRSPHRPDFPVEVLLTPIQMGAAPMLLVVWRDITERKRNEEALRQAQKLESLGVLAGGIAHDFNNLLTAIHGHLGLARTEIADDHPALEHLRHVERAVSRAADLSRQMLAYSGQGPLEVETLDLGQAVTEMVDLLRAAASGVRLSIERSTETLPIDVSPAQLHQVVMNVVTNAIEASNPDGLVTVRTSSVALDQDTIDRDFTGYALRPGRHAAFAVEDHGCGMSPDVLAKVFDPFYSTKGTGRGLGLSALAGIVRSHRGGMGIRTAEGTGTRFTVVFPWSARSGAAPVEAPADAEPERGAGLVLVVDDHPAIRVSTRGLLVSMGFDAIDAPDGESAVRAYAENQGRVRWVLMDLTMPGMNGYDAFLAIRRLDPSARVILSSGWAETVLAERFRADPPMAFLPKPYRREELEEVLRRAGLMGG